MTINNRGFSGQPILPYTDFRIYAGSDAFVDLTFLDHTGAASTPTSLVYQLDDMTNAQNMIPATTISVFTGNNYTLQLPAASLVMSHNWQGSQVCQLSMTATLGDGSKVVAVAVIELCAVQTPGNS